MVSNDTNPSLRTSGETVPDKATCGRDARPRPVLAALWAQLLAAPAVGVDKPSGRRRAELNRSGQWPAATLINTERVAS